MLPASPPKLRAFCHYSGLSHLIDDTPAPDPNHPQCETVPLFQVRGHPAGEGERIVQLVARHTELSEDDANILRVAFFETIQNVVDHAQSPIGAVCSARYMTASRQVQVAVVDRGRGIPATLRRRHGSLQAADCLKNVLMGGYSSLSRDTNAGVGICNLAQWSRNMEGRLVLVSDTAWATTGHRQAVMGREPRSFRFRGTGVFFKVKLTQSGGSTQAL